jgi:hypothetical protein
MFHNPPSAMRVLVGGIVPRGAAALRACVDGECAWGVDQHHVPAAGRDRHVSAGNHNMLLLILLLILIVFLYKVWFSYNSFCVLQVSSSNMYLKPD